MPEDLKQLQKMEALERLKILHKKFQTMNSIVREYERDNIIYVSPHTEEWERDRKELAEGLPLAYCKNLDDETTSEFGNIQSFVNSRWTRNGRILRRTDLYLLLG